jgi:hypothetical protein
MIATRRVNPRLGLAGDALLREKVRQQERKIEPWRSENVE